MTVWSLQISERKGALKDEQRSVTTKSTTDRDGDLPYYEELLGLL